MTSIYQDVLGVEFSRLHPKIQQRFPTAKRLEELTTDESTKALIRAVTATSKISKPFAVPPKLPADRLKATDNVVYFKADANFRSKIGIPPARVKPVAGNYDA